MSIVIHHPIINFRHLSLVIYDNQNAPLHFTDFEIDVLNEDYCIDQILLDIQDKDKIRIALFNQKTLPIISYLVNIDSCFSNFKEWVFSTPTFLDDDRNHPLVNRSILKGHHILISNIDNSNEETLVVYEYNGEISQESEILYTRYHHSEYIKNGKKGINQELTIESVLKEYFKEGESLFVSPRYANGEEVTDFIIYYDNILILIESKNVFSNKQTKLNERIVKGTNQLHKAEASLITNSIFFEEIIGEKLSDCNDSLLIIVYNDKLALNETKCRNLIQKFEKLLIPIFISDVNLIRFLSILHEISLDRIKSNFIQNLYKIYNDFMNDPNRKIYIFNDITKG